MSTAVAGPDPARTMVDLAKELGEELHPGRIKRVTIDSSLNRDFGIDSLARVELLLRIERRFKVAVPEHLVVDAETPRDLLKALEQSTKGGLSLAGSGAGRLELVDDHPRSAKSLVEVLEWHAEHHPDRPHITLYADGDRIETITYADLLNSGRRVAGGLLERGLKPGEPVAIMLPTGRGYFDSFTGILLAGGVPLPLYPPARLSRIEEHVRRQANILSSSKAAMMIAPPELGKLRGIFKSLAPDLRETVTVEELDGTPADPFHPKAEDLALLQYTSGSTGNPKGVMLTHANLLANIRAMVESAVVDSTDVFVSWLPLYHDMGLIGAWLGFQYIAARTVIMSPQQFLGRPHRWLRAIHAEKGTISSAPNFAYDLCTAKIGDDLLEGLDLRSWRLALNGAEPVRIETIDRFCERFAKYGFDRKAMLPVYGLAESSLGLAFPPPGRGPIVDLIRRDDFEREGRAVPAVNDEDAIRMVACGREVTGQEIRIVDASGREVPDRHQGRLEFRGPSSTSGYYRNPEATKRLIRNGWVDSGDFAYMADGDVYITGRAKDLIIRAGRNILPQELEEAVAQLPGVRKGGVVVFGTGDPESGTEKLIVAAEAREPDPGLRQRIIDLAADHLDTPPDEVVILPPKSVPKTPSGKIRRGAAREMYEDGTLGKSRRVGWQFVRLALSGIGPGLRRFGRSLVEKAYSLYAHGVFNFVRLFLFVVVFLVPGVRARRTIVRISMRAFFFVLGIRLRVKGRVPKGPCIIAANHASYLDVMALSAVLPTRFSYVAKEELKSGSLLSAFLRRLGVRFVERFDAGQGKKDVDAMTESAQGGESFVIFPEGTFVRAPGLRPFRMGAFAVATHAGIPVVPLALKGTRSLFRDEEWRVTRGPIDLTVSEPLIPEGREWKEAIRLRDRARAKILEDCGEPDLQRP